jgi:hypothetical protein
LSYWSTVFFCWSEPHTWQCGADGLRKFYSARSNHLERGGVDDAFRVDHELGEDASADAVLPKRVGIARHSTAQRRGRKIDLELEECAFAWVHWELARDVLRFGDHDGVADLRVAVAWGEPNAERACTWCREGERAVGGTDHRRDNGVAAIHELDEDVFDWRPNAANYDLASDDRLRIDSGRAQQYGNSDSNQHTHLLRQLLLRRSDSQPMRS